MPSLAQVGQAGEKVLVAPGSRPTRPRIVIRWPEAEQLVARDETDEHDGGPGSGTAAADASGETSGQEDQRSEEEREQNLLGQQERRVGEGRERRDERLVERRVRHDDVAPLRLLAQHAAGIRQVVDEEAALPDLLGDRGVEQEVAAAVERERRAREPGDEPAGRRRPRRSGPRAGLGIRAQAVTRQRDQQRARDDGGEVAARTGSTTPGSDQSAAISAAASAPPAASAVHARAGRRPRTRGREPGWRRAPSPGGAGRASRRGDRSSRDRREPGTGRAVGEDELRAGAPSDRHRRRHRRRGPAAATERRLEVAPACRREPHRPVVAVGRRPSRRSATRLRRRSPAGPARRRARCESCGRRGRRTDRSRARARRSDRSRCRTRRPARGGAPRRYR